MPKTLHSVSIDNIADLEAACRRWRKLGAEDNTPIVMQNNFTLYVTGTLREHHTSEKLSIDFDYFDGA